MKKGVDMSIFSTYVLPCLWAFLASAGVCFMYNIHGTGVLVCSIGAALSSWVYFAGVSLTGSEIAAAFLASAIVGVYSELMARLRRCPVIGYLQVALLPLVPGAGIYYTMRYCVAGETGLFLSSLLHTLGIAAALSVGAMMASSGFRTLLPWFHREKRPVR